MHIKKLILISIFLTNFVNAYAQKVVSVKVNLKGFRCVALGDNPDSACGGAGVDPVLAELDSKTVEIVPYIGDVPDAEYPKILKRVIFDHPEGTFSVYIVLACKANRRKTNCSLLSKKFMLDTITFYLPPGGDKEEDTRVFAAGSSAARKGSSFIYTDREWTSLGTKTAIMPHIQLEILK